MNRILTICLFLVASLSLGQVLAQTPNKTAHFGEKIKAKGAISYDELLTRMGDQKDLNAKVRGKVTAVCQNKGCWMTMASSQPGKPELFIKFKDYGFFMPKDIAGREVIIEGTAFKEVTGVDELRHMAEDAGKSKEEIMKITQPKEELKFMANGVILLKS